MKTMLRRVHNLAAESALERVIAVASNVWANVWAKSGSRIHATDATRLIRLEMAPYNHTSRKRDRT